MLVVAGVLTTAHAQVYESTHANVDVEVTDITIQRGQFLDHWVFTVEITNNDARPWNVGVNQLYFDDNVGWVETGTSEFYVNNQCPIFGQTIDTVEPRSTLEIFGCFATTGQGQYLQPTGIWIYGLNQQDETEFHHLLPFVSGECFYTDETDTCQSVQSVKRLINTAELEAGTEAEPMTCEVPTTTTTTEPDTDQPQLLSAAYHVIFADLVLSFDEQVTLADGWRDNITVGGISIGERANNHVDGASGLAWISVDYSTGTDIRDASSRTITIDAGTFMDADGNTNDRIRVTPTITG